MVVKKKKETLRAGTWQWFCVNVVLSEDNEIPCPCCIAALSRFHGKIIPLSANRWHFMTAAQFNSLG